MNGVYLDYDRTRYPHIARSEKRALKSGWTQAECDHVRERGLENDYLGTREERLQKEDNALRISEENGISSAEWARQQTEQESESNSSSIWICCFFAIMILIMGVCIYSDQIHHSHRAVSFE